MLLSALEVVLTVASLPVLAAAGYLFVLTLASRRPPSAPPAEPGSRRLRFDLVVPAHDEEAGIAQTVRSLLALDWPAEQRRVVVVADNCSDRTAREATRAGAHLVLARSDEELRGKGYALAMAFGRSLSDGFADAVVVVDADTVADRNLLTAFAARLERGALAVQADYGVRNPEDGPRTRLMSLAFTLFHRVRSLGRERLGLSSGLRGNGMCFATSLLREVPYAAFSLVEDVEYGLRLGEAGHRVWYADDARVLGEMVSSARASASQRHRWEEGRRALRERGGSLLRRALRRGDRVLGDLALDVLVPPLARLAALALAGDTLAGALVLTADASPLVVAPWAASLLFLAVYLARGVQLSGSGSLKALAFAPAYLVWKLALRRSGQAPQGWVRTARQGEAP
ncbi:MAG TPA: glycosyltransferase family 2 protein [Myxococcales bacterium]